MRAHANDPAKEAADLLARSHEQMDIRATGPFRLRAEVELTQQDDKRVKGTFTLVWGAPDRYRYDFTFPNASEITIVSGANIWRKRVGGALPLNAWQVMRVLPGSEAFPRFELTGQIHLTREKKAEPPLTCLQKEGGDQGASTLECFDRRSSRMALVEVFSKALPLLYRIELQDVVALGAKSFPRRIRYLQNGSALVEVNIKELATVPPAEAQPDAAILAPPTDADRSGWCANPMIPAGEQVILTSENTPLELVPDEIVVHGTIGEDGVLHDAEIARNRFHVYDGLALAAVARRHFTPLTCNATPAAADAFAHFRFKELSIPHGVPEAGNSGYTTPHCLQCPNPKFSPQAIQMKVSGTIMLRVTVTAEGRLQDIRFLNHLGAGLDERAVETVRKWRLDPAKDPAGKPAAVSMVIEVTFRLLN